jgi:predicted Zn-dependent protease
MTFSVVAPLTYIANYNKLFYFTFYDATQNLTETEHTNKIFYSNENHLLVNKTFDLITPIVKTESSLPVPENDYSGANIDFSLKEILLFASVISATDTVAALTFVKEDSHPKLFSILFGEGVLNDAVCIVLYRILRDFTSSNEGNIANLNKIYRIHL